MTDISLGERLLLDINMNNGSIRPPDLQQRVNPALTVLKDEDCKSFQRLIVFFGKQN